MSKFEELTQAGWIITIDPEDPYSGSFQSPRMDTDMFFNPEVEDIKLLRALENAAVLIQVSAKLDRQIDEQLKSIIDTLYIKIKAGQKPDGAIRLIYSDAK